MSLDHMRKMAKNAQSVLPEFFPAIPVAPPLSQCQEVVARLKGYPNWHAAVEGQEQHSPVPSVRAAAPPPTRELSAEELLEMTPEAGESFGHTLISIDMNASMGMAALLDELRTGKSAKSEIVKEASTVMRQCLARVAMTRGMLGMATRLLTSNGREPALADFADVLGRWAIDMRFDANSHVDMFLAPRFAAYCTDAGLDTLGALVDHINEHGDGWRRAFGRGNVPSKFDGDMIMSALERRAGGGIPRGNLALLDEVTKGPSPRPKR